MTPLKNCLTKGGESSPLFLLTPLIQPLSDDRAPGARMKDSRQRYLPRRRITTPDELAANAARFRRAAPRAAAPLAFGSTRAAADGSSEAGVGRTRSDDPMAIAAPVFEPATMVVLKPTAKAPPTASGAPDTDHSKSLVPVFILCQLVPLYRRIVPRSPVA